MAVSTKKMVAGWSVLLVVVAFVVASVSATSYPTNMCYVAQWNNGAETRQIYPLKKQTSAGPFYTAKAYYSYDSPDGASANTPDDLEESSVAQYFFFDDGTETSMFFIFDKPKDGSGGLVEANIRSTGLAKKGVKVTVRDDNGDSSYAWDDNTGTSSPKWEWWECCTDGMVLGNLPRPPALPAGSFNPQDYSWCVNFQFSKIRAGDGVNTFKVRTMENYYENGGRIDKNRVVQIPASAVNTLEMCYTQCTCGVSNSNSLRGNVDNKQVRFGVGGSLNVYGPNSNCTYIIAPSDVSGAPQKIAFYFKSFLFASDPLDLLTVYTGQAIVPANKVYTFPNSTQSRNWTDLISANYVSTFGLSTYSSFVVGAGSATLNFISGPSSPGAPGFEIIYVSVPNPTVITPTQGGFDGGDTVTVTGTHFISSSSLKCRWTSTNLLTTKITPATWISSTKVTCVSQNITAFGAGAATTVHLAITNDGIVYAGALLFTYVNNNCAVITNCQACTFNNLCGWCNFMNNGTGRCMAVGTAGTKGQPSSCPAEAVWDAFYCSQCFEFNQCSGHGSCRQDGSQTCGCQPGWDTKPDCSCNCPAPATNGQICSGDRCLCNGTCECTFPRRGANCECIECRGNDQPCYGNGVCECSGQCTCKPGFDPATQCFCRSECPTAVAGQICSGRGHCECGKCQCEPGWGLREDCSCADASVCPTNEPGLECSGHGECQCSGDCRCEPEWTGPQCDIPKACPATDCSNCTENGNSTWCQWCPASAKCENIAAPTGCLLEPGANANRTLITEAQCPPPLVVIVENGTSLRQETSSSVVPVAAGVSAAIAALLGLLALGLLYRRTRYQLEPFDWDALDDNMDAVVANPLYEQNGNDGDNPLYEAPKPISPHQEL